MTSATIYFKKLTTEQCVCCLSYCLKSHVSQFYCATDCGESYVTGRYFYDAWWFSVTQTDIRKLMFLFNVYEHFPATLLNGFLLVTVKFQLNVHHR